MGAVGDDSGFYGVIVTYQSPYYVFCFLLSTGVMSELKMVMSFFVKIVEQSGFCSWPIERRLALFLFGYVWDFVAGYGNIGRVKWP